MLRRLFPLAAAVTLLITVAPAFGQKKLNNLVTELADVENAKAGEYAFELAEPGWVFVRTTAASAGTTISLDAADRAIISYAEGQTGPKEAMHWAGKGAHKAILAGGPATRLQIRRVPEIRYCRYQYDPWVVPYGKYDWAFLEKHMLPHVNTIIGTHDADHARQAEIWHAQGKRWLAELQAPGLLDRKMPPLDEAVKLMTEDFGPRPWLDGFLLDEYFNGLDFMFDPSIEAIKRIKADPKFAGRIMEPYTAGMPKGAFAKFIQDADAIGCNFAVELYNCEQPTAEQAAKYLDGKLPGTMKEYRKLIKDPQKKMTVALGIMSGPPESLNAYPHVNYRVFQDMEFHILANDPEFDGLYGVMGYTSGYAEEETIRWTGKLFRHYCIEGNTKRMTDEPYLLDHLDNPDFADGLSGWKTNPAEPGSISERTVKGLGSQEGRYGSGEAGDKIVVMKRSDKAPNAVTQQVRNFIPGKLYALRMFSVNLNKASAYRNPTFDDYTTLNIGFDNAEMLADRGFRHIFIPIHEKPEERMYCNYWVRLFRPRAATVTLSISDWSGPQDPGGNIGAQTGVNFVEIQPYLE